LRPVALVPRSQLPLSCLDLASLGTLPSSRLFESHVKILELEQRIGTTPVVLIARLDDGKTLFAVERESRGLYVLCKLGSWIDLNQLCATSIVSRYQPLVGDEEHAPSSNCESQITAEARKYHKRKRLAIEALQLMVKRPRGGVLLTSEALPVCESHQSRNPDSYPLAETAPSQSSLLLEALYQKEELPAIQSRSGAAIEQASQEPSSCHVKQDDIPELPMADQILDSIRSQYFESLYLSKVNLISPE
jgi:DNA replication regulator SLD3